MKAPIKSAPLTTSLRKEVEFKVGEPLAKVPKGNPSAADAKKARGKKDGNRMKRNKGRR